MGKNIFLKRTRVDKLLMDIYAYPLTIVEAPMGYGKTAAVSNFLKSQKRPYFWIAFVNFCESAHCSWSAFSEQIAHFDKKAGSTLEKLGFPADAPQTAKVLSVLNNIDFDKDTVFVIDDYHLLKQSQLNRLIEQIVAEMIENLHIVIITRDTTDINFSQFLLKGMCQFISQQQLKFTKEELKEYCLLMDKDMQENDLVKINEYTDGWISLTYIILLGFKRGLPVGMNSTIEDLIENTLFIPYDRYIREFLLSLSVMDNFTVKQAVFVTGEDRASEILKKLRRENAFVVYDEYSRMYKIHNILLDFLRIKLSDNIDKQKRLYGRLGEWHLERKEYVAAYEYLNKAGDTERILMELNNPQNVSNDLTEFEGSYEMFEAIPEEILYKYPIAYLQHIFDSILRGNEQDVIECVKKLERLKAFYETSENVEDEYRNRIIAEILIIKKFTAFNDLEKMHINDDEIIRRLNGSQSYIMSRDNEFTFGSPHLLYIYFKDEGCFKNIMHSFMDKTNVHSEYSNGSGTGSDYLALAEFSLETGSFEMAELNSFKAIYKARTKNQTAVIMCAFFNLIRLYIYLDKINEADEKLAELEEEITKTNNPIHNTTLDLCKGYIYACLNQSEKIPYWLQTGDMSDGDFLYQGLAFNYIVYGKAVMLSKNYVKLEMLSESFNEYFSIFNNRLGFVHNYIFRAVAKYNNYGITEGVKELKFALSKGQCDHIIMPFAENAPHIMEMLNVIYNEDPRNEYIKNIVDCSRKYNRNLEKSTIKAAALSQREKEVLLLTAEGLKRNEIAHRLVLSQSTVKAHLQNIYKKLNANGKMEAVKIAKMYKII